MANPWEQAAREAKVTRLVDALDAHLGRMATRADLGELAETPVTMAQVLRRAKVETASQVTINALVRRIEEREAAAKAERAFVKAFTPNKYGEYA